MIENERNLRHELVVEAARRMMTAARTAPKGKGIDIIEIALVSERQDLEMLATAMRRKAEESGIVIPEQIPAGIELSEKEEGLIQMVADFAAVVKQAGEDYSPSIIANYTYDLVKEYNQFYHDYSILREENEAVKVFRIALSANVAKIVRLGMNLLGIEVPSRM